MKEIFAQTVLLIFPDNPLRNLNAYLAFDEWSLFSTVRGWHSEKDARRRFLAKEWEKIYARKLKWKMSFAAELSMDSIQRGTFFAAAENYEERIRQALPGKLKKLKFCVDVATQDPRPLNPIAEPARRINIFNPVTGRTSPEPLDEIYRFIPARVRHFRVFALNHNHDKELGMAAEEALGHSEKSFPTNV